MTILFLLLVCIIGMCTPAQTAINAQLQIRLNSAFAATMVAFLIGTIVLFLINIPVLGSMVTGLAGIPWYAWLGGVFGFAALTSFVILFPKIGSIQTVLLPILGQIAMSMIIDSTGLFGAEVKPMNPMRIAGTLVAVAGVFMVVLKKGEKSDMHHGHRILWQALGVVAGAMLAAQSAVNGTLGVSLNSPVQAAFISSLISTVILFLLILSIRNERRCLAGMFPIKGPLWIWIGGLLGLAIVIGYAAFAPILGIGLLSVVSILGQLGASILIDRFGFFKARKVHVSLTQYLGIAVVLAGVVLIYF